MDKESIRKGHNLRFARTYRFLSQKELCSKVKGLNQSKLSRYENGFKCLSDDIVIEIMKIIDFPISFLDVEKSKLNPTFLC